MLETIAALLIALWFLGLANAPAMGALLHGLPVLALGVIAIRYLQGRRS